MVREIKTQNGTFSNENVQIFCDGLNFDLGYYGQSRLTEEQCFKWLNILGECTLLIKKGVLAMGLLPTVDKLKERINRITDSKLDTRCGKIDYKELDRIERDRKRRMEMRRNDYYEDDDY